jgi:5-formyltetrahydrofolate cyclo-ligase
LDAKADLRKRLRAARRANVAALDPRMSALLLMRPPAALIDLIPKGATIGLYAALPDEAPTQGYAKWFHEAGHRLALPWFATRASPMAFRQLASPYDEDVLTSGPYRIAQPPADAPECIPDVVFVPVVGFSADGGRLGQGGGHYDRWLAAHSPNLAIGLAWDCQLVEDLPREPHDRSLAAVITPTRIYGPFAKAGATVQ